MALAQFTPVAVNIGTPSMVVGLTHRETEDEVLVLPLSEDGAITHEFVVVPPSQVIALRAWPPIDDGHPMLMRTEPVKVSDEPGGETKFHFAGYAVLYVREEQLSAPAGTAVAARSYVNDVVEGRKTVQGLTTSVNIADLIAPQDLAEQLERRRPS